MGCVIGIDGGTGGIRARIFDQFGHCLGTSSETYPTAYPAGARAEQDPEDWWKALAPAVRRALAEAGRPPEDVEALALATTSCSVVALDADGRALRPAIIWMDVRAEAEAAAVLATGDKALAVNCDGAGPVSAEWMLPKALWIARHEPKVFEAAATICEYQDFMSLRLTGRRCASLDNVAIRWHYNSRAGGYPRSLVKALALDALIDKWPADVLAPGEVIGPLTVAAAAHLGLTTATKVVQGGADALIGMIGLGVNRPGQLALITGSSHLMFGVSEREVHASGLWGAYPDAVYPDRWIVEGGQTSTGSIIAWLGRLAGGSMDLKALNVKAEKLEPGSEGLLVLDHFQGNRTPYVDALSRGAIVGLTLGHELHHVFRAAIEGICFGTRAILDRMTAAGFTANEITIGGGATESDLWLQIHADTTGLPVMVPESSAAPNLGSAVLAGYGVGWFPTIDDGIAAMVRPGRRIEPRVRETRLYEDLYQSYAGLYPALKPFRPKRAS
jgi:ribulose kinase